ncbi:hypothetical protein GJV11_05740 [Enterobacteriaceae bacterium RIT693]|jgi:hypothetical protein|nr:hypothetical protein [Enterobacteriaceae bacterium RIT693]
MKIYEYKDLLVQVPDDVTHLSVDADGVLRAWRGEFDTHSDPHWEDDKSIIPTILNWQKSTCSTASLREYAPLVFHVSAPAGTQRYKTGDKYPIHLLIDDEERCLKSEVHVVVSCYTPGVMLWCQVLKLKIDGLSIDNILLSSVKDILHEVLTS